MKELVECLAKALVDHPAAVDVQVSGEEKSVILELRVDKSDMGKIIGKQGRIAQALRTLVKAAAVKDGKRATLSIVE